MTDLPPMKLYVLRAYHEEIFDDADYGPTPVGTFYRDIAISDNLTALTERCDELNRGIPAGTYWSEAKNRRLCELDAEWDNGHRDDEYKVEDISELWL